MNPDRLKGYLFAAVSAAAYGTNPAFAVPLYEHGMNPNSVLLFRYALGLPILAFIMKSRGLSFRLRKNEIIMTAILGILMALSSLTLFEAYNYINAGIASTLLFVYPVMVAVMMGFFHHEKLGPAIIICLIVMSAGLRLLMKPQGDAQISMFGVILVMVSALTYAFYIIIVNLSKPVSSIPTTKLTFYVLCWGTLLFLTLAPVKYGYTAPSAPLDWINLCALAMIPTVLSLVCTTRAIQLIGSTPTAILGALEPVTAVALSVMFLGQPVTLQETIGGMLVVAATLMVIGDKTIDKTILRVRKMFPKRH